MECIITVEYSGTHFHCSKVAVVYLTWTISACEELRQWPFGEHCHLLQGVGQRVGGNGENVGTERERTGSKMVDCKREWN